MNSLEPGFEEQLIESTVQHVSKHATDTAVSSKPVGYVRAKVYGRCILVKSLVDSGNLLLI